MPEYEYSDVKYADFEAALKVYLARLEEEWKSDRSAWQTFIWNLPPPLAGAYEDVDDTIDRLYNEIMDAVDRQGISPNVGQALSPIATQIYGSVLKTRAKYAWQKQYGEAVKDWQTDVTKAVQEDWANKFRYAQWETATGLAERKFEWQQQEAQRQWQWRKGQAEWERQGLEQQLQWEQQARRSAVAMQRVMAGQQYQPPDNKEQMFEKMRQEIKGQLGGPGDWIKRWQVGNIQNPYTKQPGGATQEVRRLEEELKGVRSSAREALALEKEIASDPNRSLTFGEQQYIDISKAKVDIVRRKLGEAAVAEEEEASSYPTGSPVVATAEQGGGVASIGWGGPSEPRHTTPPTPDWLKKLYPSLGERLPGQHEFQPSAGPWGKQPSGKWGAVAPLSGQVWGGLSPSQQAGWMGYAQYTGAVPGDLLARMRKMQPRTPQIAQRWTPARQMA